MSVELVKKYLNTWNRGKDVIEFNSSSETVALAAQAAGVIPGRIAKTLAFADEEGGMIVVVAGDARVSNTKFKQRFGRKPKMLSPDETLLITGHPVGGVCPFALPDSSLKVWLDESLHRFSTVFPACGSGNSAIELTCAELEEYSDCTGWVDVCSVQLAETPNLKT